MDKFWDESFWCPPNIKWSDLKPDNAQLSDLYYSLITAAGLIALRFTLERALFRPFGRYVLGDTPKKKNRQKTINKIGEGMWRMSFYTFTSIYGWFFVLWHTPYIKDTMQTMTNYPYHPVSSAEWWYYNIELGFYISLVVTQIVDTKRSDFWQMFIHHIVTILLLVFSWACNFHRIGAVVIAIHDIADVPLEGSKLAKYCQKQRLADLVFAIFTLTWIYTRCYWLPTHVIYCTVYRALDVIQFFPAYYVFNGLLCILQLLHFAWTWVIIRIVFYALQNDGMRDLRSDSEEESEEMHKD